MTATEYPELAQSVLKNKHARLIEGITGDIMPVTKCSNNKWKIGSGK